MGQIYTILVLSLFLSAADLHLGRRQLLGLKPTIAAVLLLAPFFGLALLFDCMRRKRGVVSYKVLKDNIWPIVAFALLVCVSLLWSVHPTAYWKEKGKYIFIDVYGFLIFFFALAIPLHEFVRRNFPRFVLIGFLTLVTSILYELAYPGYFSIVPSRAAGFPRNPNFAALITNLLCAASLVFSVKKQRQDLLVLALGGLSVFCTQSRSGLVCFGALVVFYIYFTYIRGGVAIKKTFNLLFSITVLVGFFIFAFPFLAANTEMFSKYRTRFDRYESGSQVDDGSSARRLRALNDSWKLIEASPLVGHGTGFTRTMDAKPHNFYVQQWIHFGIFGVVAFLAMLITFARTFWKRDCAQGVAITIVVTFGCFFSHNLLEQRTFLILMGAYLTYSLFNREQPAQQQEYVLFYEHVPELPDEAPAHTGS